MQHGSMIGTRTLALAGAVALGLALVIVAPPPLGAQTGAPLDSDGDGIADAVECPEGVDPAPDRDGDSIPDCFDDDDDGDGIPNVDETYDDGDGDGIPEIDDPNHEDGPNGDLDGDGLDNMTESCLGTDPNDPDTDGDSVPDGEEIGSTRFPCENPVDTDGDGQADVFDRDDDGDGIPTFREAGRVGFARGNRGSSWDDPDGDGLPNHLDPDSDNDGKPDAMEWPSRADLAKPHDGDLLRDFGRILRDKNVDARLRLGLADFPDNDSDGIPDHLDQWDEDGPTGDPDQDGLTNEFEISIGTDPFDADTDGDSRRDGEEVPRGAVLDYDGDGIPDVLDADDDGDGAPTRFELGDVDGDGRPDHHDPDTTGDWDEPQPPCADGQLPDGSPGQQRCIDRDCDGIVDGNENPQEFYVGGSTFWEGVVRVFTGKTPQGAQPGSTQPAIYDGPCALEDYDCDGIVNYLDPDWTDGPGENGEGDPMCDLFPDLS